jgi:hypothetical protein
MFRIITIIAFAVSLLAPSAATATPSGPEEVAQAYAEALRSGGMVAAADFLHPDELQKFREMLVPLLAGDEGDAGKQVRQAFFGPGATAASLREMSAQDFMRGFMRFMDEQMARTNVRIESVSILGTVEEGEIVHLVTRNIVTAGELKLTALEVLSLKPHQGGWKVMLTGKMDGLAQTLKAQLSAPKAPASPAP